MINIPLFEHLCYVELSLELPGTRITEAIVRHKDMIEDYQIDFKNKLLFVFGCL